MTEIVSRIAFAGLGAAIGAGVVLLLAKDIIIGPLSNHDEPIIIDNGPLKVDFKSAGHLTDTGLSYFRDQACAIQYLRVWTASSNNYKQYSLSSEQVTLLYKDGSSGNPKPIVLKRIGNKPADCVHGKMPPFHMESTAPFENDGWFERKKVREKSEQLWLTQVKFYAGGEETTVPLRDDGQDPKSTKVKVALCNATTKCPDQK